MFRLPVRFSSTLRHSRQWSKVNIRWRKDDFKIRCFQTQFSRIPVRQRGTSLIVCVQPHIKVSRRHYTQYIRAAIRLLGAAAPFVVPVVTFFLIRILPVLGIIFGVAYFMRRFTLLQRVAMGGTLITIVVSYQLWHKWLSSHILEPEVYLISLLEKSSEVQVTYGGVATVYPKWPEHPVVLEKRETHFDSLSLSPPVLNYRVVWHFLLPRGNHFRPEQEVYGVIQATIQFSPFSEKKWEVKKADLVLKPLPRREMIKQEANKKFDLDQIETLLLSLPLNLSKT